MASLESKKAKADAKAAEEAKKTEAEAVLKKLLASGMSADEILEKLKQYAAQKRELKKRQKDVETKKRTTFRKMRRGKRIKDS